MVLTGQVAEQRLQLRGRIAAQASPGYDILVRPAGSRTALEQHQGLVRANFLSGQFGGITLAAVAPIQQLPGVRVAAPIAMVGYLLQTVEIPIDVTAELTPGAEQLFTASIARRTAGGLSTFDQPAIDYTFVSAAPARLVGLPGRPGLRPPPSPAPRGRCRSAPSGPAPVRRRCRCAPSGWAPAGRWPTAGTAPASASCRPATPR